MVRSFETYIWDHIKIGNYIMERQGDEVHVNEREASGGSKEGVVRWILIVGLLLAIVLLSVIWMTGALTQGDVEEEATVSGEIRSQEGGESTDSIIMDDADAMDNAEPADDTAVPVDTIENEPQE